MKAHAAATELRAELTGLPWIQSIGVGTVDGEPAIYIYVTSANHPELRAVKPLWRGFPIVVRKISPIRPLTR